MDSALTCSLARLAAIALPALIGACARSASMSQGSAPAASANAAMPAQVTTAMAAVGDSIFHAGSCQRCHGPDAKGTDRGPDLTDEVWTQIDGSYPQIVAVVTSGVPKEKVKLEGAPFGMRARGGISLTDEQVQQVAAYVYTLRKP